MARVRCTPRIIKRVPPWNLSLVLNALTKEPFGPLSEANLKWVTLKIAFLLAITLCRSISDHF